MYVNIVINFPPKEQFYLFILFILFIIHNLHFALRRTTHKTHVKDKCNKLSNISSIINYMTLNRKLYKILWMFKSCDFCNCQMHKFCQWPNQLPCVNWISSLLWGEEKNQLCV